MRFVAVAVALALATTAAQAQDWSGPYIGLGLGVADGGQDTGSNAFPLEGTPVSLFGGYNFQSGAIVYGAELAFHTDDVALEEIPSVTYNELIDLKARIGYATGRTLAYGVVGLSQTTYASGSFTDDLDGWSIGLGADVMVTDRVFAGAEYLHRSFDHTTPGVTSDINTFALRVGVKF